MKKALTICAGAKTVPVFLAIMCACCLGDPGVYINSVTIVPPKPTPLDEITIISDGWTSNNFIGVDYTDFDVAGNSLQLDIYCSLGMLTIVDYFHHYETIGTLSPADYDLTVRTFSTQGFFPYVHDDTYVTSFTVVPEPATVLLLGFGGLGLLRRRKSA